MITQAEHGSLSWLPHTTGRTVQKENEKVNVGITVWHLYKKHGCYLHPNLFLSHVIKNYEKIYYLAEIFNGLRFGQLRSR